MKTKKGRSPCFSIVMATYNRGYCLAKAIESVINQNYPCWELVIVDDGSRDNTKEIVKRYCKINGRISSIFLDRNYGVNYARNVGVRRASYDYIVLLDSDNQLHPDALSIFHSEILACKLPIIFSKVKFASGQTYRTDVPTGRISYKHFLCERVRGEFHGVIKKELLLKHPFFEDIMGGEAITWKLIAKNTGGVFMSDKVTLFYNDLLNDRLSVRSKNYKRLFRVFAKDLKVLGPEYLKHCPTKFMEKALKYAIYGIMSVIGEKT